MAHGNETQRKMLVNLSFLKGPRGARGARLEVMDDVSGQTIAALDLDSTQLLRLMSSEVFTMRGHTSRVVSKALSAAQDC